jgi:light-regulated signal transduction histidine kinase (bacteriophytochrome)
MNKSNDIINAKCQRLQEDSELLGNLASHGLKSPLVIIETYCNSLQERYKNLPISEEKEWLNIIQAQATRMREMVNVLYEYLSIENNSNREKKIVDTNQVLQKVLTNIDSASDRDTAKITYDTLPPVMANEKQCSLLFANLLDNALKFKRVGVPLKIHISATQTGDMVKFSVADNGIGIAEEFQEFIFLLFQKLPPAEEYPGLGAGLGLCKKIVQCLGGDMWVESELNKGSTFFFTLQAAPRASSI